MELSQAILKQALFIQAAPIHGPQEAGQIQARPALQPKLRIALFNAEAVMAAM